MFLFSINHIIISFKHRELIRHLKLNSNRSLWLNRQTSKKKPYRARYMNHDRQRQFYIWHWQEHLCFQQWLTWPQQQTSVSKIKCIYHDNAIKKNVSIELCFCSRNGFKVISKIQTFGSSMRLTPKHPCPATLGLGHPQL